MNVMRCFGAGLVLVSCVTGCGSSAEERRTDESPPASPPSQPPAAPTESTPPSRTEPPAASTPPSSSSSSSSGEPAGPPPPKSGPNGELCYPNIACNGINECSDKCFGERCCDLLCGCTSNDTTKGTLSCLLRCP